MLELDDIHTYYGTSHVLQGVSLSVVAGRCVALLGRNGVGKTTTVHSIAGLTPPRQGSIRFRTVDITAAPPYRIARLGIGLVPQGRRVFPSLTVRENLMMAARDVSPRAGGREPWTLARVYALFPALQERERNAGHAISGGQQQMLAIGRALLTNPYLLLMDEPSEGLAPVVIEQVGEVILQLKESGLSLLLVEQHIALAYRVADELAIMNKGRIVWTGTPAMLQGSPAIQHEYLGV